MLRELSLLCRFFLRLCLSDSALRLQLLLGFARTFRLSLRALRRALCFQFFALCLLLRDLFLTRNARLLA